MKKILYLGLDVSSYQTKGCVTHFPVIEIIPIQSTHPSIKESLTSFSSYTHLLITSKSSTKILSDYLPLFGYGLNDWQAKKTIAIGRGTAKDLQNKGIEPFLVAQEESSEGLIKELSAVELKNSSFFWPHSAQSRPLISHFFHSQSAKLKECILYHTKTLQHKNLPDLNHFDEIVFTSPSTVKAFLEIFGSFPTNKKLTPIGPITAAFLKYEI